MIAPAPQLPAQPHAAPDPVAPPAPPAEPFWIRELWDRFFGNREVQLYLAAFRGIAFSPRRFAVRWATGEPFAQNPLLFMATSAALLGTAESRVLPLLRPQEPRVSLGQSFLEALLPYAYYGVLAVVSHVVLRLFGSRRRVLSTVAMALYAGGSWATLSMLAGLALLTAYRVLHGLAPTTGSGFEGISRPMQLVLIALVMTGYALFNMSLARALGGLHGRGFLRTNAAVLCGLVVAGFLPDVPILHLVTRVTWWHGVPLPKLTLWF